MTNTSTIPVTIDGVRLDTLAYNIETLEGRMSFPGSRGENAIVPGDDGSIFIPNKSFEDTTKTLKMWVRGADVNGTVPIMSTRMTEFRSNMDRLFRLFAKKNALIDMRQTWPAGDIQWLCTVDEAFDLSTANAHNPLAKFAVVLKCPGVFGQDVNTTDYASASGLSPAVVLTLTGYGASTAPIRDAIIVVRGPATNPRITDVATGAWVQYSGTIATGTDWRVDCGIWDTRTGSAIGLSGGGGTVQVGNTSYGAGGTRFISLQPTDASAPQIRLDGSSFGGGTQVLIRARRKFIS
jgi:hypothetical protein